MKVIVLCEESQEVCKAFRALGHEAYSNDLQKCSGGHPEWHLQMDCWVALFLMRWDLVIMHPTCTALTVSGNSTYAGTRTRHEAAKWTQELFKQAGNVCERVAMENPVGVLNTYYPWLPKPYYIQPYQFGHPEQKKTGIWSIGLPQLQETNNVYKYMMTLPKKEREKNHYRSPGPERAKLRSKTYPGIAAAFAQQWGVKINL